jgi:hypothetical protein
VPIPSLEIKDLERLQGASLSNWHNSPASAQREGETATVVRGHRSARRDATRERRVQEHLLSFERRREKRPHSIVAPPQGLPKKKAKSEDWEDTSQRPRYRRSKR